MALQLPKLSNNRKREHQAVCSSPSRLVLKHIISTIASQIKAKVKGGEDGKHHSRKAPYATSISQQKAVGPSRGCGQASQREMMSSSMARRTCSRAGHFTWCWLANLKSAANATCRMELPQLYFKMTGILKRHTYKPARVKLFAFKAECNLSNAMYKGKITDETI